MPQPQYLIAARQHLTASPQLQQAVRLLQMSSLELEQTLRDALASNPFLEESVPETASRESGSPESASSAGTDAAPDRDGPPANGSGSSDGEVFDEYLPEPGGMWQVSSGVARNGRFDDELEVRDWSDAAPSLRDHLRDQLLSLNLQPRERLAAAVVIETLDDDGYLRANPADSAAALDLDDPLTADELEQGTQALQAFDPIGVGARSLQECLARQLEALPPMTPERDLALCIVRDCLEMLARREDARLCARLGCSSESLKRARALIRKLNPKPGDSFTSTHAGYVTPDVLVTLHRGKLRVATNPDVLPRTRLNRNYIDLLRRSREQAHPALHQALQEARVLLRNTHQRFDTIRRVAESIVKAQRSFFAYGDLALKPMTLRNIADELGLHESTVSRATGNKYMSTPRGTFEFKHFFSRPLTTGTGGSCSAAAVRALMQELLDGESREEPLSDVDLARILRQQGINVARRTVAKYRNQLRIPAAELRREP